MTSNAQENCQTSGSKSAALLDELLVVAMLLGLAAFLGYSYLDGRVPFFVASYYVWMTPVTAIVLFAMAAACVVALVADFRQGRAESCDCHCGSTSWVQRLLCVVILIVPIALGLALNPRRFSPEGLRKRRLAAPPRDVQFEQAVAWVFGREKAVSEAGSSSVSLPDNPTVMDVLEAARAEDAASLDGKYVTLIGQCDLPGGSEGDRIDLYRLVVTCCVADASAVSLEVARPADQRLEPGTWVRAAGILRFDSEFDPSAPVLHATTISRVPEPSEPYLSTE